MAVASTSATACRRSRSRAEARPNDTTYYLGREQLIRVVSTQPRLLTYAREEDRQHIREGLELAATVLEVEPFGS